MIVPLDKLLHFSISALLVVGFAVVLPLEYAVLIALAAGSAKEMLWNGALRQGDPSWSAALADLFGVLFGVLLVLGLTFHIW